MIQRKQTVFFFLAAVLALVCLFMRLEWMDALLAASAALSGYTIFLYAKRPLQARLCLLNLVLILMWYILLAALQGSVDTVDLLPMVDAILILMARKGILDDEKLVRAADRIR